MKKEFIISIIAIISLAGIAGYYLATKQQIIESPKETEFLMTGGKQEDIFDWKVYRNEKYGFEVRYPREWFGGETSAVTNDAIFRKEAVLGEYDFAASVFRVQIFENEKFLSLKQWWQERDKEDGAEYIFEGEIKINQNIIGYRYKEKGGLDSTSVIFQKSSFIFLVSRIGFNDELFNKFLNSVKFYK